MESLPSLESNRFCKKPDGSPNSKSLKQGEGRSDGSRGRQSLEPAPSPNSSAQAPTGANPTTPEPPPAPLPAGQLKCNAFLREGVGRGCSPLPALLLSAAHVRAPQTLLSAFALPRRQWLSCTYFKNKITALAQGHLRQSWTGAVRRAQLPAPCCPLAISRPFHGVSPAQEVSDLLPEESRAHRFHPDHQDMLCSSSQQVFCCQPLEMYSCGLHHARPAAPALGFPVRRPTWKTGVSTIRV